eukprot:8386056-Pyramimonas_sp.AAC.1
MECQTDGVDQPTSERFACYCDCRWRSRPARGSPTGREYAPSYPDRMGGHEYQGSNPNSA